MSFYRFNKNDIFYNRLKTYPEVNFVIHAGKIYYKNQRAAADGKVAVNSNTTSGHINLFEMNVNRSSNLIYPFLPKNSDLSSFKTIATTTINKNDWGQEITGSYPLQAAISRQRIIGNRDLPGDDHPRKRIIALRNTLDFNIPSSFHYAYTSDINGDGSSGGWNKSSQEINLVTIPSIFYGSSIEKGSVNLKYYVSGSVIGELKDENKNGELIQVGPVGSEGSGSVAGVVLYGQGFMLLTGSWELESAYNDSYDGTSESPKWLNYACINESVVSSSYSMDFNGINYVPVMTMMAHAPKGELNFSNNPTYLISGSAGNAAVSSESTFSEPSEIKIKNIVSSSFDGHNENFQKETYISKVGIYDKDKNLIAIAKLATPIKKTENRDFTVKMKLDF